MIKEENPKRSTSNIEFGTFEFRVLDLFCFEFRASHFGFWFGFFQIPAIPILPKAAARQASHGVGGSDVPQVQTILSFFSSGF
jgi:hypothetical protein